MRCWLRQSKEFVKDVKSFVKLFTSQNVKCKMEFGKSKAKNFPFYFCIMKRSLFPILTVAILLGLLCLLAGLQYRWLGQISDGERTRLQNRLQTDTERFAEDFNREIQNVYYGFHADAEQMRDINSSDFAQQFDLWKKRTNYPNLIKEIYFVQTENNSPTRQFNFQKRVFEEIAENPEFEDVRRMAQTNEELAKFNESTSALILPIYEASKTFDRVMLRTEMKIPPVETPKKAGVIIIHLDENTIKNQILPDLATKYFSDSESSNYRLAVTNQDHTKTIFQTLNENLSASDASAKLLNLSNNNFSFLINRQTAPNPAKPKTSKKFVLERTTEFKEIKDDSADEINSNGNKEAKSVQVRVLNNEKPQIAVFNRQTDSEPDGYWTLNVQHSSGSLEQFITNTRRKNLAVSFGILSLLAISSGLIFVSAQRAKRFAQKQVDFVSAVSHEFRTPLAVIYSAGENLTDGVISSEEQIARYGNLIKREGKKLSQMVEQILEFAGARSGRKKYDWREIYVKNTIENAIKECQPLIDEKDYQVETEISENLPPITADSNSLNQAIQNLIINSIKYGNGNRWMKVSAANGSGDVKITVEDKGIGIAKREIGQIFQPFYRSKSVVEAQIHGNGLGLSLVKQTVEAHNGRISVESEIGKGSRFTIYLPVKS